MVLKAREQLSKKKKKIWWTTDLTQYLPAVVDEAKGKVAGGGVTDECEVKDGPALTPGTFWGEANSGTVYDCE